VRWISLLGVSWLAVIASAVVAAEELPAGGLSIRIPEQQRPVSPTGVDLLTDGGFEGVTLSGAKAPAWQATTHVYSYDQEGVRELARRLGGVGYRQRSQQHGRREGDDSFVHCGFVFAHRWANSALLQSGRLTRPQL
jgi:hypothetical protein